MFIVVFYNANAIQMNLNYILFTETITNVIINNYRKSERFPKLRCCYNT